jgi:hypothetical protein
MVGNGSWGKESIGFVESIESVELEGKFFRSDALERVPKVKKTVHGAGRTVQGKNKDAELIFSPQTHADCRRH